MNFFQSKFNSRFLEHHKTTKILPKVESEDLPRHKKITPVVLSVPQTFRKMANKTKHVRTALRSHVAQTRHDGKIVNIGDINNSTSYNQPVYKSLISKQHSSSKVLPHRFAVECNSYSRLRTCQKSKPRLRKLVIRLN